MDRITEKLEHTLKSMGLPILDLWDDGFTYAVSIKYKTKGVFVVYTTKGIHHYRHDVSCLRILQASEHIPFADVGTWPGGDFILPYTMALANTGKCIANYGRYFCPEELPHALECAATF